MLIFFLKLVLAHIIGDFVLQTKSMVAKRKQNIGYLLLHVCIHTLLLIVVFLPDTNSHWYLISFISVSHLAIDSLKIYLESKTRSYRLLFFCMDQVLHLAVLLGATYYSFNENINLNFDFFKSTVALIYSITFLLIAVVSPIFLRIFFSKWEEESVFTEKKKQSLLHAGLLIGVLERLMIVIFIQLGFLEGIGFLLAAKSIFRFGDLANAKDTKFTEYILVGTLASFFIAIVIGLALKYILTLT